MWRLKLIRVLYNCENSVAAIAWRACGRPASLPAPAPRLRRRVLLYTRRVQRLFAAHAAICRDCAAAGQCCCRHDIDGMYALHDCFLYGRPLAEGFNRHYSASHFAGYLTGTRRVHGKHQSWGRTCPELTERGCALPAERYPFGCSLGLCRRLWQGMSATARCGVQRCLLRFSRVMLVDVFRAVVLALRNAVPTGCCRREATGE